MEIKRQVMISGVPRDVIFYTIELIAEGVALDAKTRFSGLPNFKTEMNLDKRALTVKNRISFLFYDYLFNWKITKEKEGYLVTLVAKTPGRWWEPLFEMRKKLLNLVDTQWSALYNFCLGFVTAVSYLAVEEKAARKEARKHVRRSVEKVKHVKR